MLAIKYNYIDAINVLCDHDADIKHKSFDNDISPLDYVINKGNKNILKIIVNAIKKQKFSHWENNKKVILNVSLGPIRKLKKYT